VYRGISARCTHHSWVKYSEAALYPGQGAPGIAGLAKGTSLRQLLSDNQPPAVTYLEAIVNVNLPRQIKGSAITLQGISRISKRSK